MITPSVIAAGCLFLMAGALRADADTGLTRLVKRIQPAVATVIVYDEDRNIANIGTGFFINPRGHLITNFHVLAERFAADIRTSAGKSYRVKAVLAENRVADLLKLEVDIPSDEVSWIPVGDRVPDIAEQVVVVGSPMGLEQTVSEGIVSSLREIPPIGTVFQMSAPISPGSSGSPVVNPKGQVLGIATFQFIQGQNLNFAVSARQILALRTFEPPKTVSEWTYGHQRNKARTAEALCQKGFSFFINGEDQKAIEYFKAATENDPADPEAWSGLGSCYAGMDNREDAIAAYKQAVEANPQDETAYFFLGNYYGKLGRYEDAVDTYRQAVAINSRFEAAYFNLGMAYARLNRYDESRQAFETVVRINPDAGPAHYNAGIAYGELGRHREALAAQERVLRLNPEFAPAHYARGKAYAGLKMPEEEFSAYKEAIRIDPDFAPGHYAVGEVLLRREDKAGAFEQYRILRKLDDQLAQTLFYQIYPRDEKSKPSKRASKQPKP